VRRRNLIPREAMPFDRGVGTLGTQVVYDSGDFALLLDKMLAHLRYDELQEALAQRRARGEMVGFGLAYFVEKSGLGPFEKAIVNVESDGGIEIVTGAASIGQGIETVMAQICAETLGVPIESMRVIHGQTDRIDVGGGAFASRVTVMTGSAVKAASEAVRDQAIATAAVLLAKPAGECRYEAGRVTHPSGGSLSLAEIARKEAGGLSAEGSFRTDHMNYPYGVHAIVARVDPETCGVHIERFIIAFDIGRMINPMLVEGQLAGGAAQGIGGALLEELIYDDAGQPLATTFADYLMPTIAEMPDVEILIFEDAPSPQNPLGVKGAGEGGINAAGAAIAAAIDAAIGQPGAVRRLPISPVRLHEILRSRNDNGSTTRRHTTDSEKNH
jgi:aerobic carbon-monoxide dehydrogenase large subunit